MASTDSSRLGTKPGLVLSGGLLSGIGIGYKQHFDNGLGLQIAGGGIYMPFSSEFGLMSLGAQVYKTISKNTFANTSSPWGIRAYIFAGSSINYYQEGRTEIERTLILSLGAGPGLETFFANEHVSVSVELPFSVMMSPVRNNRDSFFVGVFPIPNISLTYYF